MFDQTGVKTEAVSCYISVDMNRSLRDGKTMDNRSAPTPFFGVYFDNCNRFTFIAAHLLLNDMKRNFMKNGS